MKIKYIRDGEYWIAIRYDETILAKERSYELCKKMCRSKVFNIMKITFTYYTVTPESAENGEFEDNGFYDIGGWKYSWSDSNNLNNYNYKGGLQQALIEAKRLGCCEPSESPPINTSRIWFSSVDGDTNYLTGEQTYYSVHFDGISPRTLARIVKELM